MSVDEPESRISKTKTFFHLKHQILDQYTEFGANFQSAGVLLGLDEVHLEEINVLSIMRPSWEERAVLGLSSACQRLDYCRRTIKVGLFPKTNQEKLIAVVWNVCYQIKASKIGLPEQYTA